MFGFNLAWSVGSIRDCGIGMERLSALEQLFSTYPENVGRKAAEDLYQSAIKNLDVIRSRAEHGETLRMWYSNQPDEMCGMFWLIHLLESWKQPSIKVVLVKLSEWEVEDTVIVRHSCWGEVEPGKWHNYPDLQKAVPEAFINDTASRWSELQKENAPLRAVINGKLQSVPGNFYDDFILREIALEKNEFREANLIGRIIAKYQPGISGSCLALRIEEMIHAEKLEVVSSAPEDEPGYCRILKKRI